MSTITKHTKTTNYLLSLPVPKSRMVLTRSFNSGHKNALNSPLEALAFNYSTMML